MGGVFAHECPFTRGIFYSLLRRVSGSASAMGHSTGEEQDLVTGISAVDASGDFFESSNLRKFKGNSLVNVSWKITIEKIGKSRN